LFLNGPAGRLEALLNEGRPDAPYSALVCHPHPLYGGTMHNKVAYHAMKALNSFGVPVLRFNFRGAGASAGEHDQGRGERDDVRTALDFLVSEFQRPILFAGFSFGAAVGLRACCPDPRVRALVSLGTPVSAEGRSYTYRFLADCTKPKLFVSGDHDQYGPVDEVRRVFETIPEPKQLVFIKNADHFFEKGHLPEMRSTVEQWLREFLKAA
jgi:alpha/beta superfamily hydrolase